MGPILEVEDLKVHFFLDEGVARAVDGVSFSLEREKRWELWVSRVAEKVLWAFQF